MEGTRIKTALGDIEYHKNNSDIKRVVKVTIGRYYNARFEYIEDALKFVELAISGGADPSEIKMNIIFTKGEDKDATED